MVNSVDNRVKYRVRGKDWSEDRVLNMEEDNVINLMEVLRPMEMNGLRTGWVIGWRTG